MSSISHPPEESEPAETEMTWQETVVWLTEKHYNRLYRRGYGALWDKNNVEDLIQDVFERLLRSDRSHPAR